MAEQEVAKRKIEVKRNGPVALSRARKPRMLAPGLEPRRGMPPAATRAGGGSSRVASAATTGAHQAEPPRNEAAVESRRNKIRVAGRRSAI
jgi:hypothetical protein